MTHRKPNQGIDRIDRIDAMDARAQQMAFDGACDGPGSWLISALTLWDAARRLHPIEQPSRDDEMFLDSVFYMLLALSFENLLKGMIAIQGTPISVNNKLNPYIAKHELVQYAEKIDPKVFVVDVTEMALLKRLEPYLTYGGRYPMPKEPSKVVALIGYSNHELDAADVLWKRLYTHLKKRGWITKCDGSRLPMR